MLFHFNHLTVVVDNLAVEPFGIGRLFEACDYAGRSGLDAAVLDGLDVAVDVLHQQQAVECRPAAHHLLGTAVAGLVDGSDKAAVVVVLVLAAYAVDNLDEVAFEFALNALHVHYHRIVAQVAEIADAIEEPEGRRFAVFGHRTVAFLEADGHLCDSAEHRAIDGRVGVVDAKPDDAAQLVGQPAAALCHEREACLLRRYGALVDVLLAVDLEVHRAPTVWTMERACSDVAVHIHRCAFKMVAHQLHNVVNAEFAVGFDPQWQTLGSGIAHSEFLISLHSVGTTVEHCVDAGFASAEAAEGKGIVGVGKGKVGISVLWRHREYCKAVLFGKSDDIGSIDAFHFGFEDVLQILAADALVRFLHLLREGGDAGLVGVAADVTVGHTSRHPHGTLLEIAFAGDFPLDTMS